MKNLFTRLMLVAVAAMGVMACQTEPEITTVPEKNTFTLTVTAEQETTRTYLSEADENGVYQAQWNEAGEVIRIFEYVNNSDTTSVASTGFERLTGGTAKFTAELTKIDEATVIEDIDYYAIYPESNRIKSDNTDITAFKFNTPTEQTPTATSFDGNADFMIAKPIVDQTEQLKDLSMSFKRLVSIGKMTLTNLDTESTIESVDLTFSLAEGAVAGYSSVDLTASQYTSCYQKFNTLKLSYNEPILKDDPIYFVSLPVCISAGDSFEIVVKTTDGCVFTRTVKLDGEKEIKLTEGNMTGFKVNMSEADKQEPSTDVFTLLTDENVSNLNAGDKIIIAAAEYDVALSTTQNKNNRGQASITKNDQKKTITTPGADVQILTLEAGTKTDTFAFNTGNGYLYAASSSSNYLRTETTLSDNSSWNIEVSDGIATIKAKGTNNRNWLRYNSNSSLFSCYGSGQEDVAIYYIDGEEPDYLTVSTNKIEFSADGGGETFTVSMNFEAEVSVTCDNSLFSITQGENGSYTVTAPKNEATEKITGTITVTAGEFTKTIAVTQEAVPVEAEEITIAEFIEKADATTEYKLTGTISNVVNTTYGNFDLTDASGKIYVYGLYSPEGDSKYWLTAGVKAGDVITIQGTYALYNDTTHEVVNAKYVSHYGVTAEKTSVEIDAIGGESTIAISLVNTDEAITATSDNAHFRASIDGENLVISADANETEAAITGTITIKAGDAYTEINVSQAKLVAEGEATPYSYTFTSKQFSANGPLALGVLSWTLAGDGGYWGYDGTKGQQFGSSGDPYKSMTLATDGYEGGIKKIVLNTSGASSVKATCTITVGGTQIGEEITITTTATNYTFTSGEALKGKIVISYTQTSSKAIYIKSIAIN